MATASFPAAECGSERSRAVTASAAGPFGGRVCVLRHAMIDFAMMIHAAMGSLPRLLFPRKVVLKR